MKKSIRARNSIKQETGFVLMESLISLSLIAFVVMTAIPLTVDLLEILNRQRIEVETDRIVADSARNWNPQAEKTYIIQSYNMSFEIKETSDQLSVKEPIGHEKSLEILSVDWTD